MKTRKISITICIISVFFGWTVFYLHKQCFTPCRFSGIKEEDMKGVTTTLRDVQAVLLSLFTDKTILMGHSLESDLIATKVGQVI